MDSVTKHDRANQLLSQYKKLLTEKQQRILEYYYEEDYSLQEIADILTISRNAVHDHLKKAQEKMEEFDAILELTTSSSTRLKWLDELEKTPLTEAQKKILTHLKKVI